MKLICVVFKEESPEQFTDTVELFNYGFQNFQILNVSENEEKFNIENVNFFQADNDIFGNSRPILSIDTDSYVIVPNMANFSDLDSTIDYHIQEENHVAKIDYTYSGVYVGSAYVNLSEYAESIYQFEVVNASDTSDSDDNGETEPEKKETADNPKENDTIYINVKNVLIGIMIFAAFFICLFIIRALIVNKQNSRRRKNRVDRKKHRRERVRSNFDDFDF